MHEYSVVNLSWNAPGHVRIWMRGFKETYIEMNVMCWSVDFDSEAIRAISKLSSSLSHKQSLSASARLKQAKMPRCNF